jgi:hypothetical protein
VVVVVDMMLAAAVVLVDIVHSHRKHYRMALLIR